MSNTLSPSQLPPVIGGALTAFQAAADLLVAALNTQQTDAWAFIPAFEGGADLLREEYAVAFAELTPEVRVASQVCGVCNCGDAAEGVLRLASLAESITKTARAHATAVWRAYDGFAASAGPLLPPSAQPSRVRYHRSPEELALLKQDLGL